MAVEVSKVGVWVWSRVCSHLGGGSCLLLACLGASVGGSGDVGVPGATPVSGPSGLAFGVDDDAAAGRDGGNVDVGGVVAVAAACVSALLVLILCCCLGL